MRIILAVSLLTISVSFLSAQETFPVVTSDSGQAFYHSSELQVVVSILADYQETLKEWDRPDSLGIPKVRTKTKFATGDIVVPFVTFAANENIDSPLLVDADVILPNGTISKSDHASGVVLATKIISDGNFYREENILGFRMADSNPAGHYIVRLKIYNSKKIFCIFKVGFQLD